MSLLEIYALNKYSDDDNDGLETMTPKMVHIECNAESLEELIKLLLECKIEAAKNKPFHLHLRDSMHGWSKKLPDIVINCDLAGEPTSARQNQSPE